MLDMDRRIHDHSLVGFFCNPSVIYAIHQIVRAVLQQKKPVSICGEAAGDPAVACLMIGLGVRELSINPLSASRVFSAINRMTLGQMNTLAGKSLKAETESEVGELLSSVVKNASG